VFFLLRHIYEKMSGYFYTKNSKFKFIYYKLVSYLTADVDIL